LTCTVNGTLQIYGGGEYTIDNVSIKEVLGVGFQLNGTAGARINASARSSVAMERQQDGTYRFAPCNRLFPSNDYSAWTKNDCVISAGATAPDGGASSRLTANAGTHAARAYAGGSLTLGEVVTWYCVARYVNNQWLWLRGEPTGASEMAAAFDIQNGVVGGRSGDLTNHGIASIGGGWYLCWITQTMFATVGGNMVIRCGNSTTPTNASIAYAGTEAVDLWHSGMCSGSGQPTIVPTTTAAVFAPAVTYDSAISNWRTQSEAAATNLALWSRDMGNAAWQVTGTGATKVSAAAALGDVPMYRINVGSVGGASIAFASAVYQQSLTFTNGAQYTVIFVARAVSGTSGFRISLSSGTTQGSSDFSATTTPTAFAYTFTADGGTATGNVAIRPAVAGGTVPDIEVGGFMVLAGSWPASTSPILTGSATATRAAEIPSIPNFLGTEGLIVADFVITGTPTENVRVIGADSGAGQGPVYVRTGLIGAGTWDGTNDVSTANAVTLNQVSKAATSWKDTAMRVCLNGGTSASGTYAGTFDNAASLYLGVSSAAGANPITGGITRFRAFNKQPSDAQQRAFTV
jgi:hypothetical protein